MLYSFYIYGGYNNMRQYTSNGFRAEMQIKLATLTPIFR